MSAAGAPQASAIRTVIVGATGRMGTQLLRLLPQYPRMQLAGAIASERSAALGCDVGVPIRAALPLMVAVTSSEASCAPRPLRTAASTCASASSAW